MTSQIQTPILEEPSLPQARASFACNSLPHMVSKRTTSLTGMTGLLVGPRSMKHIPLNLPENDVPHPSLAKKNLAHMVKRTRITFDNETMDSRSDAPLKKRRRFQRRNSKTAAMLLHSMSSVTTPECRSEVQEEKNELSDNEIPDGWLDDSLQIAEELVRQLQLRRRNVEQASI